MIVVVATMILAIGFAKADDGSQQLLAADEGTVQGSLFVEQPTVVANPNPRVPLAAIVEFQTQETTTAVLEITDGVRQWRQPLPQAASDHRTAVLGMYPNHTHQIVVKVRANQDGRREASRPLEFTTPRLPDSFPPIRTLLANGQEMEPGITVFAVNNWMDNVSLLDYGYLIALDHTGRVVWFCRTQDRTADSRVLKNGHLIYQHGSYRYLHEIDILGRDHRCWYAARTTKAPHDQAIAVDVDTMHHEIVELPNGNLMTLATELRRFDRYPTSEIDSEAAWEPAWVVCDEVIEFVPDTGEIVQRLPLTDLLDTQRFGHLALSGFWRDKYNEYLDTPARDWSHANSLQYVSEDDSILVSLRHLDCVVKIDWKERRLQWILGDPTGWSEPFHPFLLRPIGKLEWFYHQHAAHFTDAGTLMMFDNGNYRAVPYSQPIFAPDNSSRVVAFQIDSSKKTVRQVYSFGAPQGERFYSPFFGEAELMSITGNLLITDGGRIETEDGIPFDEVPGQRQWARIFEITGTNYPKKVFEVVCESPLGSRFGWSIYRSNRYPSLFDPFRFDADQLLELPAVFPRPPIEKLNPLEQYEPIVVPANPTVQFAQ